MFIHNLEEFEINSIFYCYKLRIIFLRTSDSFVRVNYMTLSQTSKATQMRTQFYVNILFFMQKEHYEYNVFIHTNMSYLYV